jgi:hypothetical protein
MKMTTASTPLGSIRAGAPPLPPLPPPTKALAPLLLQVLSCPAQFGQRMRASAVLGLLVV